MSTTNSAHLVERVAERLRGVGGLSAPEPAPERDIRRLVRRDPENAPQDRRSARRSGQPSQNEAFSEDTDQDAAAHLPEAHASDRAVDDLARSDEVGYSIGSEDGASGSSRDVVDATLRSPPVQADGNTSLTVPDTPRLPPLDMAALEKAGLVVGHKVRTRISEEFRITVGHLLRSMHANYSPGHGAPNVIMVTSARPGEGKSFSTLNLAGSIAQHTQREVLLVDVDAKQRSISNELGLSERPGLLDLSTNTSLRIEDVIVRTAIPHLSVITIGSGHTVGTGEISPTRPVTALVERIARRYPNAVVLLDAPPCLSTSDPSTLAPFVGQIVMVVEAERTQRNEIVAALDLVKACSLVTLMLNKIRLTTSYTFGAYHYFGTYS
jgi:protein-tyrosine kinase